MIKGVSSVAILYFTDSPETEASLDTARAMYAELGPEATIVSLTKDTWKHQIDDLLPGTFCLLASHGGIGENGILQAYLEAKSLCHSHSSALTSGILANKHLSKLFYLGLKIPTPSWYFAGKQYGDDAVNMPLQKPVNGGSKQGIRRVDQTSEDTENIYEQVISGEYEIGQTIVRSHSGHKALKPVVRTRSMQRWGELKDANDTVVSADIRELCAYYAIKISEALDCYGTTKTDFVIGYNQEVWAIETDAIPGFGRTNVSSLAAEKSGISYRKLLDTIMEVTWKATG